ncbi:MAG: lipoyl domain-containing protein [Burkholderiales bacterium]|nr:lipoyl domain-containing protein [Burkholderiales bacterium]
MIEIRLDDEAWTDVEEGTEALLDEWSVRPGTVVQAGQTIAIVAMVKSTIELESPVDGTVMRLLVEPQGNFARGQVLAEILPA